MKKSGSNVRWMGTQEYTKYLTTELDTYRDLFVETGLAKK
jgi:hypothetical protein